MSRKPGTDKYENLRVLEKGVTGRRLGYPGKPAAQFPQMGDIWGLSLGGQG